MTLLARAYFGLGLQMPSRLRVIIGCRDGSVEDLVVDAVVSGAGESAAGDSMVEGDVVAKGDVIAAGADEAATAGAGDGVVKGDVVAARAAGGEGDVVAAHTNGAVHDVIAAIIGADRVKGARS